MVVTANRSIRLQVSSGITFDQTFAAATNVSANGAQPTYDLAPGFNAFTIPVTGGSVPTGVTILPPATNTQTMILKGVTGDTGISIHRTDPTSIGLNSAATTFGITAGGAITGVRLIYT